MDEQKRLLEHRKRKRRRRADRPAVSGWLQPSDQLKGNIGLISEDLFTELFHYRPSIVDSEPSPNVLCVAIAPWVPLAHASIEDTAWTILPVRTRNAREQDSGNIKPNTIQFSASSPALRSIAEALQANPFGKSSTIHQSGFEVQILDVKPLSLETIYVTIDGDALDRHDEVQRKFGGGFLGAHANGHYEGNGKKGKKIIANGHIHGIGLPLDMGPQDNHLTSAIREALESSVIARQGDLLPLRLPAHPITHEALPPSQILSCEPVNQGLPTKITRIIVHRSHRSSPRDRLLPTRPLHHFASSKSLTDFDTTDGDGTSNEAFHSAAESGATSESEIPKAVSESEEADTSSDTSSDESVDGLITMSTPSLTTRSAGSISSRAATTPRPNTFLMNGTSTPGSIFSGLTTTTARQGATSIGKTFKAQGLLHKIPDEMLHPKPAVDEDDECRVFIDMKLLIRVGCFSGDWVRIEPAVKPAGQQPVLSIESSNPRGDCRPAKIYGLPDLQTPSMPRSAGGMPRTRRTSVLVSSISQSTPSTAWFSPILLANLGHTETVRISPLSDTSWERHTSKSRSGIRKIENFAFPPVAREMTLLRVATPLSTERAIQTGLFTALKRYFEQKRRVVHHGDMIALPIDVNASRLFAQSTQMSDQDEDIEEFLTLPSANQASANMAPEIAWFKVGDIAGPEPLEAADMITNVWSSVFCIDPRTTRMRQAGTEQCKLPPRSFSSWHKYCDLPLRTSGLASQLVRILTAPVPKPHISGTRRRLCDLIAAATSPRALHLSMGPLVVLLHSTQRNIGKATLACDAASDLGIHTFSIDAYDLLAEGVGGGDLKAEAFLKARAERALTCGAAYTSILLRHVEAFTADRMATAVEEIIEDVRVLIATTTELEKLSEGVRSLFTHELEISAPDEGEREGLLRNIVQRQGLRISTDIDFAAIAVKSAALVAGNLVDIVERAVAARQERLEQLTSIDPSQDDPDPPRAVRDVLVSGGDSVRCLTKADFDLAVEAARKNFADAIGAPKIPNVSWDDVGGLENVKDAVMETIQLPLERPELFAKGMKKRSGILFYGPPGTGKTLLAKAIATEFSLNFFSIKGPELLNMYIGESEANVRRVFQRARDARPCVVFFDELDSVAPKRGNQGDSGGVMDRIVSQLLAELDGMSDGEEGGGGVFVIGATNRPDLLDQALLRPGRFDKMLYLGVSDTNEKQLTILEALTRKFTMHPNMSLRRVAESLPFTYTGADLYALCSDAMLKAITRQASAVDAKIKASPGGHMTTAYFFDHLAKEEDIAVMVTEDDFAAAERELVGSVR